MTKEELAKFIADQLDGLVGIIDSRVVKGEPDTVGVEVYGGAMYFVEVQDA